VMDTMHAQVLALDPGVTPQEVTLEADGCVIGRAASCHIIIRQKLVSRLHARIECNGPRFMLIDTNSANGTFVNRRRIREPHLLQHDDIIGLGSPEPLLRFLDPDPTYRPANQLRYDERAMLFILGNQPLDLTPTQFRLLHHLYHHAGDTCSRESCAQALWGRNYEPGLDAGALDQAFNSLRRALRKADPDHDLIQTRRGLGYTLVL